MKRSESQESIDRLEKGLSTIANAQIEVDKLSKAIKAKEPELEEMSRVLEIKDADLKKNLAETEIKSKFVAEETDKQNIVVEATSIKKKGIEEEKKETEEAKKGALKLADSLDKKEISEVSG